jgi:galactose mutarotase-like enzyme
VTTSGAPQRETIAIAAGPIEADFVPSANMVCCSLRHRGRELLAFPHGLEDYATRGKTMGIPLLYPWANRLAAGGYTAAGRTVNLADASDRLSSDPNGLPMHGALPDLLAWEVVAVAGDRVTARLDWSAPDLLELFPFVHQVTLEAVAGGDRLTLTTIVTATGDDQVPVAFGFHPFLTLGPERESWEVELGASRRMTLDALMIPTGARTPLAPTSFTLGRQSWDDALDGITAPAVFSVADGELRLTVTFGKGFPFAQVYAPPGGDFICFEPMTAPANSLRSGDGLRVLAPGGAHRAVFSVAVEELKPPQ